MRTVTLFKNGNNQAVRLPKDMEYHGVSELEIIREGDTVTLRPTRNTWASLLDIPEICDADFLTARPDIVTDEGRF